MPCGRIRWEESPEGMLEAVIKVWCYTSGFSASDGLEYASEKMLGLVRRGEVKLRVNDFQGLVDCLRGREVEYTSAGDECIVELVPQGNWIEEEFNDG